MGATSLVAAGNRPHRLDSLLWSLDRPARAALELSQRPLSATLAPALLGIFLVAAASAAAGCISLSGFKLVPRLDALRAVFEALLVVVPGTTVFAIYLRLRIPARAFLAATALGLFAAGVVAACLLPLMAFLAVVAIETRSTLPLPLLFVPGIALATVGVLASRVMTSLDGSRAAYWLSRAFVFFLVAVFFLRINAAAIKVHFHVW
ncbi:hypothetical protein [Hyalangium rubrum]|uniref:Lipoprotein n=1 Tax=Hyalangium rubrum TaxID=3103134 RepID=A0ABU5HE83_9BACT|nr:hypothetical protein [Hyalangium sp. s54d21]MDY7231429.1 hypothetical protein [Hyalangium sp. s54d21]